MKKIKEYLVFTSPAYRIVMFGVLPVVCVAGYIWAALARGNVFLLFVLIPMLLVLAEVVADNWMFGGIQEANGAKMDFLKTSPKGMKLLESALTLDLVRRLLTLAAVLAVGLIFNAVMGERVFGQGAEALPLTIGLALTSYTVSVLFTLITRFFTVFWWNVLIGYAGFFVEAVCCWLVAMTDKLLMVNLIFAALAVGATVLTVKVAMARIKGGYYEK